MKIIHFLFSSSNDYKFLKNSSFEIILEKYLNVNKKLKIISFLILLLFLSYSSFFLYKLLFNENPLHLNMKKYFVPNTYRILFVFGTRPEAIKLFS